MAAPRRDAPGWFRRAFDDWPAAVLRPVTVSLLTAFLLFILALAFKPLILDLIHGRPVQGYPILCAAEPWPGPEPDAMGSDFFIVNRLGDAFTHLDLTAKLRVLAPDGGRSPSPDIVLRIGGEGRFSAAADEVFNRDKGRLVVTTDAQARSVRIRIERIAPRAVMKVNITVHGLPYVDPGLSRAAKTQLRYDHERYLDGCHAK